MIDRASADTQVAEALQGLSGAMAHAGLRNLQLPAGAAMLTHNAAHKAIDWEVFRAAGSQGTGPSHEAVVSGGEEAMTIGERR